MCQTPRLKTEWLQQRRLCEYSISKARGDNRQSGLVAVSIPENPVRPAESTLRAPRYHWGTELQQSPAPVDSVARYAIEDGYEIRDLHRHLDRRRAQASCTCSYLIRRAARAEHNHPTPGSQLARHERVGGAVSMFQIHEDNRGVALPRRRIAGLPWIGKHCPMSGKLHIHAEQCANDGVLR